jgi:anti-sigma factor RsiW
MNANRARGQFSAYFEGNLEHGLKEALERTLANDPALQEEFRSFADTMNALDRVREEEVRIPADLHERISRRLDHHFYEVSRSRKSQWLHSWKSVVAAAAVGCALVVAAWQVFADGRGGFGAGLGGPFVPNREIQLTENARGHVQLEYRTGDRETVEVRLLPSGDVLQSFHLSNQTLRAPVENRRPEAVLLEIRATACAQPVWLALPGTNLSRARQGEGTIGDLALALSDAFRTPVELRVHDLNRRVSWSFTNSDAVDAASLALSGGSYHVVKLSSGILSITEN